MRNLLLINIYFICFLALLSSSLFAAERSYDEFLTQHGVARSRYKRFQDLTGLNLRDPPRSCVEMLSNSPLDDRNQVAPFPLILTRKERDLINKGVSQRIRALTLIFEDTVIGNREKTGGIIPQLIIDLILQQSRFQSLERLQSIWQRRDASSITFMYGPDVVRTADKRWVVFEDNIGPIGGVSDVDSIANAFENVYEKHFVNVEIYSFAKNTLSKLLQGLFDHSRYSLESSVTLMKPISPSSYYQILVIDNESGRTLRQLSSLGLTSVSSNIEKPREDVVKYIVDKLANEGKYSPIFVFNDASVDLDGLFEQGLLDMLHPPGVIELLSNKMLLPYVDLVIEKVLDERVVLPSLASFSFQMVESKGEPFYQFVSIDQNCSVDEESGDVVFKLANSAAGFDVYVTPRRNLELLPLFFDTIFSQFECGNLNKTPKPTTLVAQKFQPHSHFLDWEVDLRPISLASGNGESILSDVPWARAFQDKMTRGSGQSNVSQGAYQLVVIVEDE